MMAKENTTGPEGPGGPRGWAGLNGINGEKGVNGAQGSMGREGAEGPIGKEGEKGPLGVTGDGGSEGRVVSAPPLHLLYLSRQIFGGMHVWGYFCFRRGGCLARVYPSRVVLFGLFLCREIVD